MPVKTHQHPYRCLYTHHSVLFETLVFSKTRHYRSFQQSSEGRKGAGYTVKQRSDHCYDSGGTNHISPRVEVKVEANLDREITL